MAKVKQLPHEKIIATVGDVILTNLRVVYNFREPLLTSLLTGRIHTNGVAPLQHVSAIETTRRRYPVLLFIAIAGLLSGIALYSERENISQSDPSIAFCVGVGLLFLLLWLIVTKDTLVISVDGERFVAIAERLAAAEVDKFLYEYTALKASAFEGGKLKRESSASSLGDFTIN